MSIITSSTASSERGVYMAFGSGGFSSHGTAFAGVHAHAVPSPYGLDMVRQSSSVMKPAQPRSG